MRKQGKEEGNQKDILILRTKIQHTWLYSVMRREITVGDGTFVQGIAD